MKKKYSKDFPNIEEDLEKINDIMKEYLFCDLLSSVYCINICINNRSALQSQLTLNLGLKTCNRDGIKTIKNYNEFNEFFGRIKEILDIDHLDDPIIEDFGTVQFKFENNVYNVILGTGYNSVYAQLYFLKPLAIKTSLTNEVNKVLKYNSDTIEFFKRYNVSDEKTEMRFVLPPKALFNRTIEYFKQLDFELLNEIDNIVTSCERYIEKEHFIEYEGSKYPLYNTSILIDLFDKLYKKLSKEEKIELANLGIIDVLSQISKMDQGEFPFLYFPVNICDKSLFKIPYTFLWRTIDSTILIGINKDRLENDNDLKSEIAKILELAKNDNLKIMESVKRNEKGYQGITVTKKCEVKFIIHDSFVNLSETRFVFGENRQNDVLKCSALDLVYMLLFMKDINEIVEYIDYNDQKDYKQMIGFGGDSSRFLMWKSFNHMFAKGAIQFGMIDTGINTSDEYVMDYFENTLKEYPWNNNDEFLLSSPFSWNIERENNNIYRYTNKIHPTFFGYIKYLKNNGVCFFAHNVIFFNAKDIEEYRQVISLIDDINLRKMKTCNNFLDEIVSTGNNFLEIMFMPKSYAKKVGLKFDDNRNYVYSDCIINSSCINIRYTVNYEKLYKDIMECDNRSIENEYVKELFLPLSKYFSEIYSKLIEHLDTTNLEKKEVDIVQIEIDYIYNHSNKYFNVDTKSFLLAKKDIAKICLNNNIQPGEYYGKDANKIVRSMQKDLISFFENEVAKYNQIDLHYKLLELYSSSTHTINIHRKRYDSITNVTEEVLNEVQNKIIEERENERRNVRTILYLIETNLFLKRDSEKKIDNEKLNKLLALSHWLIILNDSADICHFTDNEAHVEIDYEYVVDNIIDKIEDGDYSKRVYSKNDYTIANDAEDNKYLEKVLETFKDETEIDLKDLFEICDYFQIHFLDYTNTQISPNVYKINKKQTIEDFKKLTDSLEGKKYSIEKIEKIIEFLTIDATNLKTCKNKTDFYLPINERENRDNRFEIKPILCTNDELIFSPVIIKNIHDMWFNGILNFMLPYEIGLNKTTKEILIWKKRYENKMVYDIKEIFEKKGISFVKVNVELYKIDRKQNYPIDLGDYDIIAIDDISKRIWIIESKVLNRVGSFYEMFAQQRNFFLEHKYDEKFQRRIDFMNENYKSVLRSYGFSDVTGYKVVPYMIFNKVMTSRYKKVNFPIISIKELEEKIS